MKYFEMFSGIGGFKYGIDRAAEKLCIENERLRQERIGDTGRECGEQHNGSTDGFVDNMSQSTTEKPGQTEPEIQFRGKRSVEQSRREQLLPGLSEPNGDRNPECIGFSEIDKYAISIYKKHYPDIKNYGDANLIDTGTLPDFDILVGGFPCQSFSIAGKRKGFEEARGTLFFEIARVLRDKRPRYLVLENVKGLLSHDEGKTFRTIIGVLSDLGYGIEWAVLNSKHFGVPQNRERVFIVGHLRGERRPEVFLERENSGSINGIQGQSSNALTARYKGAEATGTYIVEGGIDSQGLIELTKDKPQGNRVYDPNGIATTIASQTGGLGAKTGLYQTGSNIRRLTPVECERLQGFPEITKEYKICLDLRKNCASAGNKNHKLQKSAGNAEAERKLDIAKSVKKNSSIKNPPIKKLVQKNVHIFCGERTVEVRSQGKLLSSANIAKHQNLFPRHIQAEDFAHLIALLCLMLEKIIRFGKVESHLKEPNLIHQENGKSVVRLFGKEIMPLVKSVKSDSITLKELLKSTTLNHSNTKNTEQDLKTLFSFVINAITGYTQNSILNCDILNVDIKTQFGWTEFGADGEKISDTQRYKVLGNAVSTPVIEWIFEAFKNLGVTK